MNRFYTYTTIVMVAGVVFALGTRLHETSRFAGRGKKTLSTPTQLTGGRSTETRPGASTAFSRDELHSAIHLAAKYLIRTNQTNGQFIYRKYLDGRTSTKKRYNMLRHAGTLYSLAEFYDWHPDNAVVATLQRGTAFMRNQMAPVPGRPDLLALWSDPDVTGSNKPESAKLGGAGLALVALARLHQIDPGVVSIDEMRKLGEFIVWMQKEDGGFYSKFLLEEQVRSDSFVSLYYPGEAVLGLVLLYEADPQTKWLKSANDGLAYLARIRDGSSMVPADHWALIATSEILSHLSNLDESASRDVLIRHAMQICISILNERPVLPASSRRFGGFARDGRTCPTATRLEGLLSCLKIIPDDQESLRTRTNQSNRHAMAFLLRAQVDSGPLAGAMPRAIGQLPAYHPDVSRHFNRRVAELRVDYVQHALCAMIAYDEIWSQLPVSITQQ